MSVCNSTRPPRALAATPIGRGVDTDALKEALRDAAAWLKAAGDTCGLQSLKEAAARAQATLAEVDHHG